MIPQGSSHARGDPAPTWSTVRIGAASRRKSRHGLRKPHQDFAVSSLQRHRLGLPPVLLALGALVALQACRREATATRWSEVAANDPRVVGVFQTLDRHGLTAALDSLEQLAKRDSLVLRSGHQLAHALGRQAFATGGHSDTVIAHCRADFGAGCYHGVVEASLNRHTAVNMSALERMCAATQGRARSGSLFECVHGVGHGVLGAVGGDVSRALHDCDQLGSDALRGSCHEGVFMEAITTAVAGDGHDMGHAPGSSHAGHGAGLTLDPGDPYSPCRSFQGEYGQACWIFQGFVILRSVQFDAGRALGVCDHAPRYWASRCFQSVGHQLTGLFQRDDQWVIARCGSGRPEVGAECASGAVLALIALDWSGGRARTFCGEVPGSWQEACRGTYERRMAALQAEPRAS
jgi:hypothetical protein